MAMIDPLIHHSGTLSLVGASQRSRDLRQPLEATALEETRASVILTIIPVPRANGLVISPLSAATGGPVRIGAHVVKMSYL